MLPDTGERYLSTPLFADIPEQMTYEELALSNSTAGHRFDASIQVTIPPPKRDVPEEDAADRIPSSDDAQEPIVVFGLEWCEFTWSVLSFLRSAGLPFRAINLDGASLRAANMGDRLRWALRNKVASATLPQVFLAGRHIGGATETLRPSRKGSSQESCATRGLEVPAEQSARATAASAALGTTPPRCKLKGHAATASACLTTACTPLAWIMRLGKFWLHRKRRQWAIHSGTSCEWSA